MNAYQMRQNLRLLKQINLVYATRSGFCKNNAALSVRNRCEQDSFILKRGLHLLSPKYMVELKNYNHMKPHSCYFSNEVSTPKRRGLNEQEARDTVKRLLDAGVIQVPEPRVITSLPDKVHVTGREENFIGFDLNSYNTGASSFPLYIAASSEKEQFLRFCIPSELPNEKFLNMYSLEYDQENKQYIKNGEALETVEQKQAFSELLEYLKKHENPVLATFKGRSCSVLKLYSYTKDSGLYTEIVETVPCFIDVFNLATNRIPGNMTGNLSLKSMCQFCLQFDVPNFDASLRATGIRRLFAEYLLPKGFEGFVTSLDFYYARNTYAQMVADDKILNRTANRLAKQGVCLDHLQFLKKKGNDEFKDNLSQRYIPTSEIDNVFQVI